MESMPRRARPPISAGLLRRRRVVAGCAVLILLAHLLLAQLTLGLALAFVATGRVSRWRLGWLAVPTVAGFLWALAIGPGPAGAGFTAGPAHILGYLGQGGLLERLGRPGGLFAGAGSWLPRQFPVALIAAAAEAGLIGWLDWLRSDESTARPRRPGAIAAVRTRLAAALIRAGAVLTRDGCALGVTPATGAVVELRWPEMAAGLLVAGAADREVAITSLQVVHAALRRRKPLIVIDMSADAAIARALAAACAATGTALRQERADADLAEVIAARSAALVRVESAAAADRAAAEITALAAGLRGIGVDADGLVWLAGCEWLSAQAVAGLIGAGRTAGLAVLIGTGSAAVIAGLAGLAGAVLVHRIADPSLAQALGPALAGGSASSAGAAGAPPGSDRGPRPAVAAGTLLVLGRGEFVLAVRGPRRRLVTRGRLVPSRLPRSAPVRQERMWRRLRYGPA